jgi:hypothetical protein
MLFILFLNVRGKKYMQREDMMVIRENDKAYRCQLQIYLCTLLINGRCRIIMQLLYGNGTAL